MILALLLNELNLPELLFPHQENEVDTTFIPGSGGKQQTQMFSKCWFISLFFYTVSQPQIGSLQAKAGL